jgi:hypothetical protein
MSSLPGRLQAAIPIMNQPRPGHDPFDPAFREALLQWGLEQIEREIQPDPVYRPLDYLRKAAAEREWRRVVREQGTAQRAVVAGFQTTMAQEAFNDILFEIAERRRRSAMGWDKEQRIDEFKETTSFSTSERIREAQALAGLGAQYQTPQEDAFSIAERFERKIAAIRADSTLSNDAKHQQTLYWQEAMRAALQGQGKQGRG